MSQKSQNRWYSAPDPDDLTAETPVRRRHHDRGSSWSGSSARRGSADVGGGGGSGLARLLAQIDSEDRIRDERQRMSAVARARVDEDAEADVVEVAEPELEHDHPEEDQEGEEDTAKDSRIALWCVVCRKRYAADAFSAKQQKVGPHARFCLNHTGTSGYGYSFTRPDEVFLSKHDVSLDNWEDEDNDTNSRSNRKSRRAKTAKQREGKRASISTGAKKKAGQVLTPEEEFLREYGSSEEDKVADEDEPDEDGSGKLPDEPSTTKRKHFRLSDSDDSDNEDVNASTSSVCNKIGSSGGQESFVVESSDSDAEYNGKSGKKQHELQISDEDGDDLSGAEILEGKRTTRSRVDRKAMAAYHKARGSQPPSSTRKRNMVISDDQGDETAPKVWVCTPSRRFVRKRDTMARVKIDEVQDDFIINFSD